MDYQWLENLKIGDQVVIRDSGYLCHDSVATVTRITKTLIFTGTGKDERKFRLRDGNAPGDSFGSRASLDPPTPEKLDEIEKERLVRRLKGFDWASLSLESLRMIRRLTLPEDSP